MRFSIKKHKTGAIPEWKRKPKETTMLIKQGVSVVTVHGKEYLVTKYAHFCGEPKVIKYEFIYKENKDV